MQTKTVKISEIAYNRIISIRKDNETISDVIIRLCKDPKEPEIISYLNQVPVEDRLTITDSVLQSKKELDRGYIRTF